MGAWDSSGLQRAFAALASTFMSMDRGWPMPPAAPSTTTFLPMPPAAELAICLLNLATSCWRALADDMVLIE